MFKLIKKEATLVCVYAILIILFQFYIATLSGATFTAPQIFKLSFELAIGSIIGIFFAVGIHFVILNVLLKEKLCSFRVVLFYVVLVRVISTFIEIFLFMVATPFAVSLGFGLSVVAIQTVVLAFIFFKKGLITKKSSILYGIIAGIIFMILSSAVMQMTP